MTAACPAASASEPLRERQRDCEAGEGVLTARNETHPRRLDRRTITAVTKTRRLLAGSCAYV